jgi:hypothetical protein
LYIKWVIFLLDLHEILVVVPQIIDRVPTSPGIFFLEKPLIEVVTKAGLTVVAVSQKKIEIKFETRPLFPSLKGKAKPPKADNSFPVIPSLTNIPLNT